MSFDITDRAIKLLYRQRGSHLRRIDGEIGSLVIEQTPSSSPRIEADKYADADADADADQIPIEDEVREEQEVREEREVREEQEAEEIQFELDPIQQDAEPAQEDLEPRVVPRVEPRAESELKPEAPLVVPSEVDRDAAADADADADADAVPLYHFEDMPQRQLSCSITSIASIESVKTILSNLLEKELIPQAKSDFESDKSRESKMQHKLDVRIFQLVLQNLNSDLQDILDINVSNNQLLYQLKQLTTTKEELNQQLLQTRSELHELECGGDWHKLKSSGQELQSRLRLNEKLNLLTQTIESRVPPPRSKFGKCPKYDIEDLCELLNPHTGLLSCLQK